MKTQTNKPRAWIFRNETTLRKELPLIRQLGYQVSEVTEYARGGKPKKPYYLVVDAK